MKTNAINYVEPVRWIVEDRDGGQLTFDTFGRALDAATEYGTEVVPLYLHPDYPANDDTPHQAFAKWLMEGPPLAAKAGLHVGIKVTAPVGAK